MGTGHAGTTTAIQLRQLGFAGSIGLVGAEDGLPYERPPLSKAYLAGSKSEEEILIRPESFWHERDIALVTGVTIEGVRPGEQQLLCRSGERFAYGDLVWAAGGHARRLPCERHGLKGVHSIRSKADVDALRLEYAAGQHWIIVGGGFIGLEAAAVLVEHGVAVTVIESADRVLARTSAAPISEFIAAEHAARGVRFLFGRSVEVIEGEDRAEGVRLNDGRRLDADGVIVGIGIEPNVAPLRAAGAEGGDGVAVDEAWRTTLPHVWAAGDCAEARSPFGPDCPIRIESVANAAEGATAIARTLVGLPPSRPAPPWFWSNQYDLRLQTVGLSHDADEVILRGDPANRAFSVLYRRNGQVIALDCINSVRDYVQGRLIIESGQPFDPALLADASVPLKSLVRN